MKRCRPARKASGSATGAAHLLHCIPGAEQIVGGVAVAISSLEETIVAAERVEGLPLAGEQVGIAAVAGRDRARRRPPGPSTSLAGRAALVVRSHLNIPDRASRRRAAPAARSEKGAMP